MAIHPISKLNPKKRYLQVALNGTLNDARNIINALPVSDRIIVEAGTPLIKRYGAEGIRQIRSWYEMHILFGGIQQEITPKKIKFSPLVDLIASQISAQIAAAGQGSDVVNYSRTKSGLSPYIVADLKTMDRAETEVQMAASAGASAAIALGTAPTETLNSFIAECEKNGLDAMVDMMNVEYPLSVLRALKKVPPVVILHRGVDEEKFNREKMIPLHEIRRIKGNYNIMISIAGGDTLREIQRSIFNDADIVVVWKSVYEKTQETAEIVDGFLKQIK